MADRTAAAQCEQQSQSATPASDRRYGRPTRRGSRRARRFLGNRTAESRDRVLQIAGFNGFGEGRCRPAGRNSRQSDITRRRTRSAAGVVRRTSQPAIGRQRGPSRGVSRLAASQRLHGPDAEVTRAGCRPTRNATRQANQARQRRLNPNPARPEAGQTNVSARGGGGIANGLDRKRRIPERSRRPPGLASAKALARLSGLRSSPVVAANAFAAT